MVNSHASKANSYDLGRPDYPSDFFYYLYNEIGFSKNDIIADIGSGTGKITRHFLEYGSKVIAIEPDGDMLSIANEKLNEFPNFTSFQKTAEAADIETGSINHIFCGNSYHWFDRKKVVPEFRRILHTGGKIVIATLGDGGSSSYDGELTEVINYYKKPVPNRNIDLSPAFNSGTFTEKVFNYSIFQTFDQFLHGMLSASYSPSALDITYEPFCNDIKSIFDKYNQDNKLAGVMSLHCMIGKAENLNS